MLPFIKSKKDAGSSTVLIKERAPDNPEEVDNPDSVIEACAKDLIDAIHAKDMKMVAQVLKDTFEILESQPHEEGPHLPEGEE